MVPIDRSRSHHKTISTIIEALCEDAENFCEVVSSTGRMHHFVTKHRNFNAIVLV